MGEKKEYIFFNRDDNKSRKFALPCEGAVYDVFADKHMQVKSGYEIELAHNDAVWFVTEQ